MTETSESWQSKINSRRNDNYTESPFKKNDFYHPLLGSKDIPYLGTLNDTFEDVRDLSESAESLRKLNEIQNTIEQKLSDFLSTFPNFEKDIKDIPEEFKNDFSFSDSSLWLTEFPPISRIKKAFKGIVKLAKNKATNIIKEEDMNEGEN